jgi:fibronectin type 3 domain-containing protein
MESCGINRPASSDISSPPPQTGTQHEIDLQWAPSSSNIAGYHVYRGSQHNGPYSLITSNLVTGTTYADLQALPGKTAYYVVTAVGDDGIESDYSPEAQATVPVP